MTVVYRSIWSDDRTDLLDVARHEFVSWLGSKGVIVDADDFGSDVRTDKGLVTCRTVSVNGSSAQRLRLEEDVQGHLWTTTVTAIEDGDDRIGWVDLEWVSHDAYQRPPDFSSPRVARALVKGGHAWVGRVRLTDEHMRVTSDEVKALHDLIHDPHRQVPVAVFTMAPGADFDEVEERAAWAARALAGVALVAFVTGPAVHRLNEMLGDSLAVFGGAVRTYLPAVDPKRPLGFRHRYIRREQVERRTSAAGHILARMIFRQAAGVRPPEIYLRQLVQEFVAEGGGELDDLFDELSDKIEELTAQVADAEDNAALALDQQEEAQAEAADLAARVRFLEDELAKQGSHLRGTPTPAAAISETAATLGEVVELAREHLSFVVIGDGATGDIEDLDDNARASVWAQKAWKSLRALDEYARLKAQGSLQADFRMANSNGDLGTWGISKDWVAVHESKTTDQSRAYRDKRTFNVPEAVDPTGSVYMDSHIKLQPGGRPCPRIHFHDDASGKTGKIYVGWLGDHLENKQTN